MVPVTPDKELPILPRIQPPLWLELCVVGGLGFTVYYGPAAFGILKQVSRTLLPAVSSSMHLRFSDAKERFAILRRRRRNGSIVRVVADLLPDYCFHPAPRIFVARYKTKIDIMRQQRRSGSQVRSLGSSFSLIEEKVEEEEEEEEKEKESARRIAARKLALRLTEKKSARSSRNTSQLQESSFSEEETTRIQEQRESQFSAKDKIVKKIASQSKVEEEEEMLPMQAAPMPIIAVPLPGRGPPPPPPPPPPPMPATLFQGSIPVKLAKSSSSKPLEKKVITMTDVLKDLGKVKLRRRVDRSPGGTPVKEKKPDPRSLESILNHRYLSMHDSDDEGKENDESFHSDDSPANTSGNPSPKKKHKERKLTTTVKAPFGPHLLRKLEPLLDSSNSSSTSINDS